MGPIPTSLSALSSNAAGQAFAFGLGFALAGALAPAGAKLRQEAWDKLGGPLSELDAELAAAIVAERPAERAWGEAEARLSGINAERFAKLVDEALGAPGVPQLLALWRRGEIDLAQFTHGLREAKLEQQWDQPLQSLRDDRLDPAVVATSIQRGTMRDPGLLPVGPPSARGVVEPMPVADLDPLAEAAASGVNRERLAVMARNVGLPPAPGELLQLLNRGVIQEVDFYRGVSEGNTRNEWAEVLLELRRRLLTPYQYAELNLRGWINDEQMYRGAALSGLNRDDTELLFKMLGRPLTVRQVVQAQARGGTYDGPRGEIPVSFVRALEQSNVRPEWYNLAYANRYTIPSYFVLRAMLQNGTITEAEGERYFRGLGWPHDLAQKAARAFAQTAPAGEDKYVAKAETHLWTAIHRAYVDEEADDSEATRAFEMIGVPQAARTRVLALWRRERETIRTPLTPSQIRKAYRDAEFTRAEAMARLERQGMDTDDAETFLGT